jgi:outer membrane PBP1 activator LpoA protein
MALTILKKAKCIKKYIWGGHKPKTYTHSMEQLDAMSEHLKRQKNKRVSIIRGVIDLEKKLPTKANNILKKMNNYRGISLVQEKKNLM